MGKTQKFDEDQLLAAVIGYSEVCAKKIKATELAEWCRSHIKGMEEVRDYHFTRPVIERDEKTGKKKERKKLCTLRIDEINKSRGLMASIDTNMLLKSSKIDRIFEEPKYVQKKWILETRDTFNRLLARVQMLQRENEALKATNREQDKEIIANSEKLVQMQRAQATLMKQVNYVMKYLDESNRRGVLKEMGIEDRSINLEQYAESLRLSIDEVMNLDKLLSRHVAENQIETDFMVRAEGTTKNLSEEIISGINF